MDGHAYPAQPLRRPVPPSPSGGARGAALPLLSAAALLLALALVWVVASQVPAAQTRDASTLYHLTLLNRPSIENAGDVLLYLLNPVPMFMWAVALIAGALAQDRRREAIAALCVLILAPLTAEILKPLLAHPHASFGGVSIASASWPSGHATAATALAVGAVIVAPVRIRPLVAALGVLFAAVVGVTLLILDWHMPSDVLGGYLLGLFWGSLAFAWLRRGQAPRPA